MFLKNTQLKLITLIVWPLFEVVSVQMFSVTLAVFSSIFGRLCQSDRMNDSSSGKCFSRYLKWKTIIILRF